MPRPSHLNERRQELMPIVARTFAELGYHRATTAELAHRCGIQENILYRLWPDKKAMFIAAIEYVYHSAADAWNELLADDGSGRTTAERLLTYESKHHGDYGYYRVVFAGLSETDDPEVREALREMYGRFQQFIRRQIGAHRGANDKRLVPDAEVAAWAVVGLATVADIGRELGLLSDRRRTRLLADVGKMVLSGG